MSERRALIVSVGRNAAWLVIDDESELRVAMLAKHTERLTLAPGDRVAAQPLPDGTAIVHRRFERRSQVVRTTAAARAKVMAANVDTMAIVAAFDNPPLSLALIDELLAFAELHGLDALLIFTKPDLVEGHLPHLQAYEALGYRTFVVNPKRGDGVPPVASELAGRHSLLIGQSGVGKSSLYRALGGTGTTVGDLSKGGRGKQTTTSARLHRFPAGFLIDSPGIGEFSLTGLSPAQLAHGFRDIARLAGRCRFADCTHLREPDCAVRDALAAGSLAASRYESFGRIAGRVDARAPLC